MLKGSHSYNVIPGTTGCPWVRSEGHPGEGQPHARRCVNTHAQQGWEREGRRHRERLRPQGKGAESQGATNSELQVTSWRECVETLGNSQGDLGDTGKGVTSRGGPRAGWAHRAARASAWQAGARGLSPGTWCLAFLPHPSLERALSPLVSGLLASPGASQYGVVPSHSTRY